MSSSPSSNCICCAYGALAPALAGSLAALATVFSIYTWYCIGDIVANVLALPILVLYLLPACVTFPKPRGAQIAYYVAGGLCLVAMVMKILCIYFVADIVAVVLWAGAGIAGMVVPSTAIRTPRGLNDEPVAVPPAAAAVQMEMVTTKNQNESTDREA